MELKILRWIAGALALVIATWIVGSLIRLVGMDSHLRVSNDDGPTETRSGTRSNSTAHINTPISTAGEETLLTERAAAVGQADPTINSSSTDTAGVTGTDKVYIIGDPVDPEDPSASPQPDIGEIYIIGEPVDPEDPSVWPQSDNEEVYIIGEPVDPEDPSVWPQSDNEEVYIIGDPVDPEDPSAWPQSYNEEVFIIGDPIDPEA